MLRPWRLGARLLPAAALMMAGTQTLARPVAMGEFTPDHVIFFRQYIEERQPEAVAIYSNLCVGQQGRQGVRVVALRSPFESDAGSAPGVVFVVQFTEASTLRSELADATVGTGQGLVLRGRDAEAPWSFDAAWEVHYMTGELRRGPDGPHKPRTEHLVRVDPQQNAAPSCGEGEDGIGWSPRRRD